MKIKLSLGKSYLFALNVSGDHLPFLPRHRALVVAEWSKVSVQALGPTGSAIGGNALLEPLAVGSAAGNDVHGMVDVADAAGVVHSVRYLVDLLEFQPHIGAILAQALA